MYRQLLEEALPEVQERLRRAAERVGRNPDSVRIVLVTKGHPFSAVEAALEMGLHDLGENRLPELEEKARAVAPGSVNWHMIGRLQRRAAPRVREYATLVHSLDSLPLAERLERSAPAGGPVMPCLMQVNVSGESSKSGFSAKEVFEVLERLVEFRTLAIQGFMTMAPLTRDERILRRTFGGLKAVQDEAVRRVPAYHGTELSMGMSNDYELAVEEGSTIVRIGSAIFGERPE